MNYNKSYKHLEKIVKKVSNGREVLKGVHHIDNIIEATDSHRALRVYVDKMNFDEHINGIDGNEVDGKYPDLENLIDRDYGYCINLSKEDVQTLREMSKVFKKLKFQHFIINMKKGYFTYNYYSTEHKQVNDRTVFTHSFEISDKPEIEMTFNIDYIIDIFDFLYEYKDDVTLQLPENDIGIINFTVDEKFDYIILPIRKY